MSINFKSKNLLITGGAGFIGSNFIEFILNKYSNLSIINLDKLTYASNKTIIEKFNNINNYKFYLGDINDEDLLCKIFKKHNIDGVINFAAETHVDNSILNPDIFIKTNINGVFTLLKVAYNFWMKSPFEFRPGYELSRFHQISTDEVYGSIPNISSVETDKYAPNSPYSASKASADHLVRSFNKTYGLNTSISICSNNYGKNQHAEKFIPTIIRSILTKTHIPVYGDGLNVRDWIHVKDHCSAIDIIFNNSKEGETYNVGANNEINNLLLIEIIKNKFESNEKIKIKFLEDRHGHDRKYSLNSDKIRNELNWKPQRDFDKSICELIKLHKKNK